MSKKVKDEDYGGFISPSDLDDEFTDLDSFDFMNKDDYFFDCSDLRVFGGRGDDKMIDMFDKTKAIFEKVCKIPINVVVENTGHSYIYDNHFDGDIESTDIIIGKESSIPAYTRFNHELSHYAFRGMGREFMTMMSESLSKIPIAQMDKAMEIYRAVFNVIEDHRVESLMGKLYLGVAKRFEEARRNEGLEYDKPSKSPINHLMCARNFREDLVPKNMGIAIDVLKRVRGKDALGSVILTKEYIDKVVNPFILNNLKEPKTKPKPQTQNQPTTPKPQDENQPTKEDKKVSNKVLDKEFTDSFKQNRASDHRDMEDKPKQPKGKIDPRIPTDEPWRDGGCPLPQDIPKDWEIQSKGNADKEIQEFKDEIEKEARKQSVCSYHPDSDKIRTVNDKSKSPFKVDKVLARKLNYLFTQLQEKRRSKLDDTGDSINIPAYIERLSKGYGDVYNTVKRKASLSVVIAIDNSGSMHDRIHIARDMLATLFSSLEKITNVDLEAYTWSGSWSECGIKTIKSLKDVGYANNSGSLGGTPTKLALLHGYNLLDKKPSKNKLLIFMTDEAYSDSDESTKKLIKDSRRRNIKTITMGFECHDAGFQELYGKGNWCVVDTIQEAKNEVVKTFKTAVSNSIRG